VRQEKRVKGAPKEGVREKLRRRIDGPVARLRRGNAMLSRGYI